MRWNYGWALAMILAVVSGRPAWSQDKLSITNFIGGTSSASPPRTYILSPNDLVQVKVYRQDDLESKLRIAQDGTSAFPLLGTIQLGGKTVEEAARYMHELLAKDYLVDPQVSITVLEYAKRRFTVLGQVQKPGAYEIPSEESVN